MALAYQPRMEGKEERFLRWTRLCCTAAVWGEHSRHRRGSSGPPGQGAQGTCPGARLLGLKPLRVMTGVLGMGETLCQRPATALCSSDLLGWLTPPQLQAWAPCHRRAPSPRQMIA